MADAAVLASQRAVPRVLAEAGFVFRSPQIDGALASVLA
jgi:NAD dependent epimerase/dehydratase family enzyme